MDGRKQWEDYEYIECLDGEVINMRQLLKDQALAKTALMKLFPLAGIVASKFQFIYTFHVNTQATDGFRIFVNPQFTSHLDLTQKVFVMAHECMHVILNHLRRAKRLGHNHERSNIAGDYEINVGLVDMGLIPERTVHEIEGLFDKKYSKWSYEQIYDDNPPGPKKQQQQPQSQGDNDNSTKIEADQAYIDGWNKAIEDYMNGKLKL